MAVVGAARVGKTLFCINFAEYLGARSLSYIQAGAAGRGRGLLSPAVARELMVNHGRRGNGVVRTFTVHLLQQPCRRIAIVDTVSLKEKNPLPRSDRPGLLLTLQAIQNSAVIVQMIDLSCSDPARFEFDDQVGRHLADYCRQQGKLFLIAGSKADLLDNSSHQAPFTASGKIVFISSLTRAGFPRLQRNLLGEASLLNG